MPSIDISALERDLLLKGVWAGLGTPTCLVTGGYVRDRLLGRETFDLDLVLPGDLDAVRGPARRLAARLDASAHILGRDDTRVWRIETPDLKVELWPLGPLSLDDDIRRRDFSCNALMWPLPSGPLDDRVEGLDDLAAGRLRALSRGNLEHDPVRLVRAARFLAQLMDFSLDARSRQWILELAATAASAPRERIGQEIAKLSSAGDPARGLASLLELELLAPTAPDSKCCDAAWLGRHLDAAARLTPRRHPLPSVLAAAQGAAVLAFIARAWGASSADDLAPYAWPRLLRRHAAHAGQLVDTCMATANAAPADRRAFIHDAGSAFPAVLAAAAAIQPGLPWRRWWRMWLDRGPDLVDPEPLLDGSEVAALLGLEPGPALGRAVDALTEAQVRGEVRTKRGAERWLGRYSQR